jgi:hypothetical protein
VLIYDKHLFKLANDNDRFVFTLNFPSPKTVHERNKKVQRTTQYGKWLSPDLTLKSLHSTDSAMAQAVSRRPITAEARVHPSPVLPWTGYCLLRKYLLLALQ